MRFFGYDGPFAKAMGRVFDIVVLHFLWLICSLPLFTIGASTAALYTVTLKMVKNEESYIVKSFMKAWKENFKQATWLWLIVLAAGAWLLFLLRICIYGSTGALKAISLLLAALLFILLITVKYLFPIQAKFENTLIQTLLNAGILSLKHLPYSICMLLITVVPIFITGFVPAVFPFMITFWLICSSSVIAYINSFIFYKTIKIS